MPLSTLGWWWPGGSIRTVVFLVLLGYLSAVGVELAFGSACAAADVGGLPECQVADGSVVVDAIGTPGESHRYRFVAIESRTRLKIELTDLTADLDLYLTDESNDKRGQSRLEGTAPETIELTVEPGSYVVYVAADPGRPLPAPASYTLRVSLQRPGVAVVLPAAPAPDPPALPAPTDDDAGVAAGPGAPSVTLMLDDDFIDPG